MRRSGSNLRPSRRAVLRALALLPVASATACSRPRFDRRRFSRLGSSPVAILRAGSYSVDFADIVGRGLRELGIDVRGLRVLLKPNLVEFEAGTVINTNPALVAGAATALRRAGAASVTVAEGPGHRRDTEYLLTATGLYDVLKSEGLSFTDLNQDEVEVTPLATRYTTLGSLALPLEVRRADLVVSMPKLKTHHWAGMTASMKNLFGVVPGAVYGWPKNILHVHGIEPSILDIVSTVKPGLAIVDGVVGMEGDGPIMGRPRELGAVVMGTDVVAVDATCAKLIGFEPYRLTYIAEASRFLGNAAEHRICHRGEPLVNLAVAFELPELHQHLREPLPFWRRWLFSVP